MKLNHYPDTDSLYIDLSEKPSTESREISEGVVLDYDADGNLVGNGIFFIITALAPTPCQ